MKKVFAILAAASFIAFASCNNAPKNEEEFVCDEVVAVDEVEEVEEEVEETPAK